MDYNKNKNAQGSQSQQGSQASSTGSMSHGEEATQQGHKSAGSMEQNEENRSGNK